MNLQEAIEVLSMDIDDREAYYGMLNASVLAQNHQQ